MSPLGERAKLGVAGDPVDQLGDVAHHVALRQLVIEDR